MLPGSAIMLDRTFHKDSSLSLCPLWPHLTSQHRLDTDYPLIEDPYFSTLQNMLLLFCKTDRRLFFSQRRSCNIDIFHLVWWTHPEIDVKSKMALLNRKQAQMLMQCDQTQCVVCIELSREAELASDTGSLHRHSSRHIIHHISLWSHERMYRL